MGCGPAPHSFVLVPTARCAKESESARRFSPEPSQTFDRRAEMSWGDKCHLTRSGTIARRMTRRGGVIASSSHSSPKPSYSSKNILAPPSSKVATMRAKQLRARQDYCETTPREADGKVRGTAPSGGEKCVEEAEAGGEGRV